MNFKILKLCAVFLLLLYLGASCQKDEWKVIELNENICGETLGILNTINDYSGVIKNMLPEIGTNTYCISVIDSETSEENIFIACNLPELYHQDGLEIIFSGEVLNLNDLGNGNSQSDLIGTPIKLTNAKIKDHE